MDRSLDGQSASAVDVDSVSVKSIPGAFKNDRFGGTEAREGSVVEQPVRKGQPAAPVVASEDHTQRTQDPVSDQTGTAGFSANQRGKLPLTRLIGNPFKAGSIKDAERRQAGTYHDLHSAFKDYTGRGVDGQTLGSSILVGPSGKKASQTKLLEPRPHNPANYHPRRAVRD